ncbi:hypothetical protein ACR0ST_04245 [Aliidiomarina sp. Khilg15.8]
MSNETIWATWKEDGITTGLALSMKYCTVGDVEELRSLADPGTFQIHKSVEAMRKALSLT